MVDAAKTCCLRTSDSTVLWHADFAIYNNKCGICRITWRSYADSWFCGREKSDFSYTNNRVVPAYCSGFEADVEALPCSLDFMNSFLSASKYPHWLLRHQPIEADTLFYLDRVAIRYEYRIVLRKKTTPSRNRGHWSSGSQQPEYSLVWLLVPLSAVQQHRPTLIITVQKGVAPVVSGV